MRRLPNRLTKRGAAAIAAAKKPGRYADGDCLYLQVTPRGSVSWVFMYSLPNGRGRRKMGLGPYREVTLDAARAERAIALSHLRQHRDPIAERAKLFAQRDSVKTFREVARLYLEATAGQRQGLKNIASWRMNLLGETMKGEKSKFDYCAPIANMFVSDITDADIAGILRPIWTAKHTTASRLRERIEEVLAFAYHKGHAGDLPVNHPNPARLKGNLGWDFTPPKDSKTRHHKSIGYKDAPAFMQKLKPRGGLAARGVELAMLTVARTGDIVGSGRKGRPPMQWNHVDLNERLWTVPAAKMDNEHIVPLPDAAIALLKQIRKEYPVDPSGIIFVGDKPGQAMSNNGMLATVKRMVKDGVITADAAPTTHGWRSTFKIWATHEARDIPDAVSEVSLAHVVGDKVMRAYQRGDFADMRRDLMQRWDNYITGKTGVSGIVEKQVKAA